MSKISNRISSRTHTMGDVTWTEHYDLDAHKMIKVEAVSAHTKDVLGVWTPDHTASQYRWKEAMELAARFTRPTPKVGDGATYGIGSDRYPYTVAQVSPSGKTIKAQKDETFGGYGDSPSVSIPNPDAVLETFTLRKDGRYRPAGSKCGYLFIGQRHHYLDPSF